MAVNIGPRIGVDGEKEYRQQMQNIIQQTKTLASEMKALSSGFTQNSTAAKTSQEASRILTEQMKKQNDAISQMSEMLKKSASAYGENDSRTQKYQQNIYNAQAELGRMGAELQKVNSEMRIEQSVMAATSTASGKLKSDLALTTNEAEANRIAFSQLKGEFTEAKARVSALTEELVRTASAEGDGAENTRDLARQLQAAKEKASGLENEIKKTNTEMKLEQSVMTATSSAAGKLKSDYALLTKSKKADKAIAASLKTEYEESKARVSALTQEVVKSSKSHGTHAEETKDLERQLKEAREEMNRLGNEFREAQSKVGGLGKAFQDIGDKAKNAASTGVSGLGNVIKSGFTGALNIGAKAAQAFVKSVAAISTASAAAIMAAGKIGLEYNMEMESYQTNFETMLGSSESAAKKVDELKQMAAKTPFEMGDLADATQQLLAMGVASEDTGTYLRQLGDISLGDRDKLNSLVNAFGKMNSTGKVTLENINMMAEQGFNPLNVIAQQTGESMTELYERVSAGKVSLDEIKGAMEAAISEGGQFSSGMERASKTTQGMISTLKDNAKALVGEVFQPISDGLKENLLPDAIDAIDRLSTEFRENGINGMISAASDIVAGALGKFGSSLPEFINMALDIVKSLGEGIKNNQHEIADGVVKTITTLVSGLISALPELLKTGGSLLLEIAVGIAKELPELGRQAGKMIQELLDSLWAHRGEILEAGKNIVRGIWNGIAAIWGSLVDWFNGLWSSLFGNRNVNVNVNANASGSRSIDGSHAGGLRYVPFDNYLANLHKGEMVLTRQQSDMLRNTGYMYLPQNGGGDKPAAQQKVYDFSGFTVQIYQQPGEDEDALLDRLEERMQVKVMREVEAVG